MKNVNLVNYNLLYFVLSGHFSRMFSRRTNAGTHKQERISKIFESG